MEKSKLKWEDLEKNARYEPLEEELEETRKQKRSKIKMENNKITRNKQKEQRRTRKNKIKDRNSKFKKTRKKETRKQ